MVSQPFPTPAYYISTTSLLQYNTNTELLSLRQIVKYFYRYKYKIIHCIL